MKYLTAITAAFGLLAVSALAQEPKTNTNGNNLRQQASYALGQNLGDGLRKKSIDIDPDALTRGFREGLAGKGQLSDQQIADVLKTFQEEIMARLARVDSDFLVANRSKPGVQSTPSGLQYRVLREGNGPTPKATDSVWVNYRGTLTDGREFDSSYKSGKPISFEVNRVIPGWTEGLQLMKVGSKYELVIPAQLAYADRPPPGSIIGPNATLIFEVELLKVGK